jgi:hypothetical protein
VDVGFANWETRTLLTPNSRAYWGSLEKIAGEGGWNVAHGWWWIGP